MNRVKSVGARAAETGRLTTDRTNKANDGKTIASDMCLNNYVDCAMLSPSNTKRRTAP